VEDRGGNCGAAGPHHGRAGSIRYFLYITSDHCRVEEAVEIAGLLDRNTEELGSMLRALNGEYVLPEAGGDLLRDGAGVLPTGALLSE